MASQQKQSYVAVWLLFVWLITTMFLWWFALYSAGDATPEWLLRAQAVCFGSDESGLPDTSGWMLLILAPLSFLSALIIAMPAELEGGFVRMHKSVLGNVVIAVAVGLLCAEVAWAARRVQSGLDVLETDYAPEELTEFPINYPRTSKPAPEFRLIDQHGDEVAPSDFPDKLIILTFAFAHCKTVCPALVANSNAALAKLPLEDTKLFVVTLDPWRDTPGSLPSLAERWQLAPNAHLLSGPVEEVNEVIARYEIPTTRSTTDGDISHPALLFMLSPGGNIAYTFNNPSKRWIEAAGNIILEDNGK